MRSDAIDNGIKAARVRPPVARRARGVAEGGALARSMLCLAAETRFATLLADCRSAPAAPLSPRLERRLMAICRSCEPADSKGDDNR
jgi:hypothetical protein